MEPPGKYSLFRYKTGSKNDEGHETDFFEENETNGCSSIDGDACDDNEDFNGNKINETDFDTNFKPFLKRTVVADSIRYNRNKMEHHGKHLIQYKKILKENEIAEGDEFLKVDNEKYDEIEEDNQESHNSVKRNKKKEKKMKNRQESFEPVLNRTVVTDSIRYNRDKMEHHGKHLIQYKKILKEEGIVEEDELIGKENSVENGEDNKKSHNSLRRFKKKEKK